MRRTPLAAAAFCAAGAALLSGATASFAGPADQRPVTLLAQAQGTTPQATTPPQGTNLGTPLTQPQPGGSVGAGAGAPTSALPSTGGPAAVDATQGRGPPQPGSATAPPGGSVTGSSQLAPTGAIVPGAQGGEAGTGGGASDSNRP